MNVPHVHTHLPDPSLANLGTATSTRATAATTAAYAAQTQASQATQATQTSISAPGQLLSQMQQLSQQQPEEFKAVAAQVATVFQNAATQTSGPQALILTNIASQFTQAAETGTLQPPRAAPSTTTSQSGQSSTSASASGASQTGQMIPLTGAGQGSSAGGHHPQGGGGSMLSSEVQQAFQSAMAVFTKAIGTTSTTGS